MVEQHLGIWLVDTRGHLAELTRLHLWLNLLGGLAAPLFVFLAGASAYSAYQKGQPLFFRGLKMLGLGYLLSLLTPSWFSPTSFYVLHLLGVWLMLAPLLLRMPTRLLPWAAWLSLGLGLAGQIFLRVPRFIDNAWMNRLRPPWGPLRLALVEGHFPLFPWLALALLGASVLAATREKPRRGRLAGLACCGILLAVSLQVTGRLRPKWAHLLPTRPFFLFEFYPATLPFCLLVGSVCVLGFWALERVFAAKKGASVASGWLERLGQTSLSLLFVHIVLFRELFGRLGLKNHLGPTLALVSIAIFLAGWTFLSRLWQRSGYRFGFEWLLRVGERKAPRAPSRAQAG